MSAQHITSADLDRLAWQIERDGIIPHATTVVDVARTAAAAHVSPVLIGVLADPSAPEVARIRAFGLVTLMLANTSRRRGLLAA